MEIGTNLPNKDLFTAQEIADYVMTKRSIINSQRRKGHLKAVQLGVHTFRFPRAEVLRWICECWKISTVINKEVE